MIKEFRLNLNIPLTGNGRNSFMPEGRGTITTFSLGYLCSFMIF